MVLQPLLELAFILDQKMRKQKKTTRKRKNLRLRLPEQQFDAVSCQLSSAGGPFLWQECFLISMSSNKFVHISRQRPLALPTPFAGPEPSPPSLNLWLLVVRCWFLNVLVLYAPMTK